jgi:sugar phosphate isomerase/epimerase
MSEMYLRAGFLYTVTKYGDLPSIDQIIKALRELKDFGFSTCELEGRTKNHLKILLDNKELLRDYCESLGMKVINFVMMLPGTSSLDAEERKQAIIQFRDMSTLAEYFGSQTMEMDTYPAHLIFKGDPMEPENLKCQIPEGFSWNTQWRSLINIVDDYARIAADVGCKLQLHPRIGELVSNTDGMLRLRDAVRSDNLGFVFDTAQLHAQKEILPLSVVKLKGLIRCLHVSDNDGRNHVHKRLGQGTIDWEGLFTVLKKQDFVWNIAVDVANFGEIENDYRASLEFLTKLLENTLTLL